MMEVHPPRRAHSGLLTLLLYARVETVDTVADDGMLCCYSPAASAIVILLFCNTVFGECWWG